jgi:hypothetical protein
MVGCRGHDGVMSELDVIVIHIRAGQAAEYERLFAERELPRWREFKARGGLAGTGAVNGRTEAGTLPRAVQGFPTNVDGYNPTADRRYLPNPTRACSPPH